MPVLPYVMLVQSTIGTHRGSREERSTLPDSNHRLPSSSFSLFIERARPKRPSFIYHLRTMCLSLCWLAIYLTNVDAYGGFANICACATSPTSTPTFVYTHIPLHLARHAPSTPFCTRESNRSPPALRTSDMLLVPVPTDRYIDKFICLRVYNMYSLIST